MDIIRRRLIGSGLGMLLYSENKAAAAVATLKVLTGPSTGPYFRLGRSLASVIRRPGLAVISVQTNGARSNAEYVHANEGSSGFCQSDVAAWAYEGSRLFAGTPAMTNLRVLANLFTASLHVLADASAGVKSLMDLIKVRTAVAVSNPADLLSVTDVLQSCGVPTSDMKLVPLPAGEALRRFGSGEFGALLRTSPQRDPEIARAILARPNSEVLGFDQANVKHTCQQHPYLSSDRVEPHMYNNGAELATIGVSCQWITSLSLEDDVAFAAVQCLWEMDTRSVAVQGCPFASLLQIDRALEGTSAIPIHPGAKKFYDQKGISAY